MPRASAARTLAGELSMNSSSSGPSDAFEQDFVDAPLELYRPDVARDHSDVEDVEKFVLRAGESELVGAKLLSA